MATHWPAPTFPATADAFNAFWAPIVGLMTLTSPLSVFPARIRSRMAFLSASEVLVHSRRLWAPLQPQQLNFRGTASSLLAFVHGFFPWESFLPSAARPDGLNCRWRAARLASAEGFALRLGLP